MASVGLHVGALFDDYSPSKKGDGWWRDEAEWIYRDENRNPLYKVIKQVRWVNGERKKKFVQSRYDPATGQYVSDRRNMDGVRRVLYRLPQVREAIERGEPILLVEGEAAADAIRERFGMEATTAPCDKPCSTWRMRVPGYALA